MNNKHALIIDTVITALNAKSPDLAALFFNTVHAMTHDPTVKTCATDGQKILLGDWFFDDHIHTTHSRLFTIAHEILHIALDHCPRAQAYINRGYGPDLLPFDPMRWNKATDCVVNAWLLNSGFTSMPSGGLVRPDVTTDTVADVAYLMIPVEEDGWGGQGQGEGQGQAGFDEHRPYPGDPEDPMDQSERQQALSQAIGQMAGGLARLFKQFQEPKIPWTETLREALTTIAGQGEYSWRRPNRKSLALPPNIPLPGFAGLHLPSAVVTLDVSGSVGQDVFDAFITETGAILTDLNPGVLYVIFWDTMATCLQVDCLEDIIQTKFRDGGGTSYGCAIEEINNLGIDPTVVVCLTDGYVDWPSEDEILWPHVTVSTTEQECPFGKTVRLEL